MCNKELEEQLKIVENLLKPDQSPLPGLVAFTKLIEIFYKYIEKNMAKSNREMIKETVIKQGKSRLKSGKLPTKVQKSVMKGNKIG